MAQFIAVVLVVALLGGILFYLLAFPIWMIVHTATSDRFSKAAKAIWIAVILIFGALGAAIFALFASGRRAFQWIGASCVVLCIAFVVGSLALLSYMKSSFPQEIQSTVAILDQAELVDLVEQDREEIRVALATLEEELGREKFLFGRGLVIIRLNDLLELMIGDRVFSKAEHDEWVGYFESRHLIDADALERHIDALPQGRPR
ncbi:hypothetical protein ACFL0I_00120 [Gemmatimonadota bacterium]